MLTIFLLILPLIAGFALLLTKDEKCARNLALWASGVILAFTGALVYCYYNASYMLNYSGVWIPQFNITFNVGVDGISLIMIILTTLLMPFIVSSQKKSVQSPGVFYGLLFFSMAAILGVFTSLNAFLFYICWELSLVPIYFLIVIWGEGENRKKVTLKFFIYTILGSLLLLVAFAYFFVNSPLHSFNLEEISQFNPPLTDQVWLFWLIFLAFAIKTPLFPFHTWMPATYTQAPMPATMLLAGVLSKMGIYGFIRWLTPLVPYGTAHWSWLIMLLAAIGVVYASVITLKQKDLKTFGAYSSMAHTSLIIAGLFAFNMQAMQGVVFQMLVHGINIIGLLYIFNILEKSTGTRIISQMGGIRAIAPRLASVFMIIMLGSVALPLTNGFVGEFLLISGIFKTNIWIAAVSGLTIIMGAIYMLFLFQKTMLGEPGEKSNIPDIKGLNFYLLVALAIMIIVLGVYPQPLLNITKEAVKNIIVFVNI
jgi:NADH-quinone oxidoreductase subunit M